MLTAGGISSGAAWHALPGELPRKAFLPVRTERDLHCGSQILVMVLVSLRGYCHRGQDLGSNVLFWIEPFLVTCHLLKRRWGPISYFPSICFQEMSEVWLSLTLLLTDYTSHRFSPWNLICFRNETPKIPVFVSEMKHLKSQCFYLLWIGISLIHFLFFSF